MTTVTITGAGAAGLPAARALERRGVDCVILEASNDLGGRVKKDTTFTNGSFPLDLGASFIQLPDAIRPIVGRGDLAGRAPGSGEFNWVNCACCDFFSEHIAPKDKSKVQYDSRAESVDFTGGEVVKTTCQGGQALLPQQVIVTAPLSILKAGKIAFRPHLPSTLTEGHPGVMWGGFKIVIEFEADLAPSALCSAKCYSDAGETYFWGVTRINEMLPNNNAIVMGYIVGTPDVKPSLALSDGAAWQLATQVPGDRLSGQASDACVKHVVINWSQNPDIRGARSSRACGEAGAQSARGRAWVAGEALPAKKSEQGWVGAGALSGDDAAKQVLSLSASTAFDDKLSLWGKVAADLGRGG